MSVITMASSHHNTHRPSLPSIRSLFGITNEDPLDKVKREPPWQDAGNDAVRFHPAQARRRDGPDCSSSGMMRTRSEGSPATPGLGYDAGGDQWLPPPSRQEQYVKPSIKDRRVHQLERQTSFERSTGAGHDSQSFSKYSQTENLHIAMPPKGVDFQQARFGASTTPRDVVMQSPSGESPHNALQHSYLSAGQHSDSNITPMPGRPPFRRKRTGSLTSPGSQVTYTSAYYLHHQPKTPTSERPDFFPFDHYAPPPRVALQTPVVESKRFEFQHSQLPPPSSSRSAIDVSQMTRMERDAAAALANGAKGYKSTLDPYPSHNPSTTTGFAEDNFEDITSPTRGGGMFVPPPRMRAASISHSSPGNYVPPSTAWSHEETHTFHPPDVPVDHMQRDPVVQAYGPSDASDVPSQWAKDEGYHYYDQQFRLQGLPGTQTSAHSFLPSPSSTTSSSLEDPGSLPKISGTGTLWSNSASPADSRSSLASSGSFVTGVKGEFSHSLPGPSESANLFTDFDQQMSLNRRASWSTGKHSQGDTTSKIIPFSDRLRRSTETDAILNTSSTEIGARQLPPRSSDNDIARQQQQISLSCASPTGVMLTGPANNNSGAGRYECKFCSKRFARPSSLKIHIHSHTGEKPFKCETCGRGFSVQSNLRRHQKVHDRQAAGLPQSTQSSAASTETTERSREEGIEEEPDELAIESGSDR